jgi:CheY-like chemotaxis protein
MRILIVEDCGQIRELLREIVEMKGGTALEAATLKDATTLLDSQPFDLLLSDGQFPVDRSSSNAGNFGPWLCQYARELGIRTLLLTASDELADRERALGFPAVKKPFSMCAIWEAMQEPAGALA